MDTFKKIEQQDIEYDEIRGFDRTLREIEWLLVILVVLYLKIPGSSAVDENAVLLSIIAFACFILFFHYKGLKSLHGRWKLAVDTWVMIAFITLVVWQTGKIESPLLSLYFLVIITAAITLGKKITLLEVGLISSCYLFLSFYPASIGKFSFAHVTAPLIQLFSLWFVAYLSAMLSGQTDTAKRKIQHLSQTDSLTGQWNMRMFSMLIDKEYKRSLRYQYSFSVMMIDADNLKPVNDTYGHQAGSNLIRHIAKIIKQNLRATDTVARFGGDEFVALLTNLEPEMAMIVAERVRKAIENDPLFIGEKQITVTVSIGISGYPNHGAEINEIINNADKALYRSKRSGKNKTTIFSN